MRRYRSNRLPLIFGILVILAIILGPTLMSLGAQVPVRKDAPRGAAKPKPAPFRCVVPTRLRAPDRADSLFAAMLDMSADTIKRDTGARNYSKVARTCVDSLVVGMLRWNVAPPPPTNLGPVARFSIACTASLCTLDASSSTDDKGIVSYQWSTSDPRRGPKTGVRITREGDAGDSRSWQETLTVTDAQGATGTITQTVAFTTTPPPPPTDTVVTPPPPDTTTPPPVDTTHVPPPDTTMPPPPAAGVTLPTFSPNTARPTPTRTIRLTASGNLQTAIDTARRGDAILLPPGATYTGNYILKPKSGAGWITIRSDVADRPANERITPATAASFATVRSINSAAAFEAGQGVRGYRFDHLNIECSNAGPPAITYNCVTFGDTHAKTYASQAGNFVIEQSWVHGTVSTNMQRCIAFNSDTTSIVDSWVSDCHAAGFDSQAIAGWNGPGPFKINNNYLEGAGENIIFGGADPEINGLIPSDIEIRGNHFFKPLNWKGTWLVKNLFELKNSRRILAENNVFENNWADGQQGFAILFKSVNQTGVATWSQTIDLTFRNNVIRCSPSGLTLLGVEFYPAQPLTRASVTGNFFDQMGTCNGTTAGRLNMFLGAISNVALERNTYRANTSGVGGFLILDNAAGGKNLVVRDNVSSYAGPYDAEFMNGAGGAAALAAFGTAWTYTGNVIGGLNPGLVFRAPPNNSYPATVSVSAAGVATSSVSLAGKGADPAAIASIIARAVVPWPTSHPRAVARGAAPSSASDWWARVCRAPGQALPVGGDRNGTDPCAARGLRRAPR